MLGSSVNCELFYCKLRIVFISTADCFKFDSQQTTDRVLRRVAYAYNTIVTENTSGNNVSFVVVVVVFLSLPFFF